MSYRRETIKRIKAIQNSGNKYGVNIPKWIAVEILQKKGFLPKRKHSTDFRNISDVIYGTPVN